MKATGVNDNYQSIAGAGEMSQAGGGIPPRSRLVGDSSAMRDVWRRLEAVAPRGCTVLIRGESGTGKEVAAREIHRLSARRSGPFIAVDCTTLHGSLFESQLFGHVRGAFTGAERETLGFFRAAHGGTLLLDEIGELSFPAQAKLLRCIQQREVVPVGGTRPVPVDVRVLAATHRDLNQMVEQEKFRLDLYYRLNVVQIQMPALRERGEDVALLAVDLLDRLADLYEEPRKVLGADALRVLQRCRWPGNVRQLAHALEHGYIMSRGDEISADDLPAEVLAEASEATHSEMSDGAMMTLNQAQRKLVADALREARGVQNEAARLLGIDRRRLYRLVRRYELSQLTK